VEQTPQQSAIIAISRAVQEGVEVRPFKEAFQQSLQSSLTNVLNWN
jgi:hypothetical protein